MKNQFTSALRVRDSVGYKIFRFFNFVIMLFVCAVTLYPFLYLVAQSFSSEEAIMQGKVTIFPVNFNLATYISVFKKGEFIHSYGNTVLYTLIGTAASMLFSCLIAYPLSKEKLFGSKFLLKFIIFTMYFGGGLIPTYILMQRLGLVNKISGFIIPSLLSTYYIILMRSFFKNVPKDLEEAGEIDGLTPIGTLVRIVLPLSMPIIATMILFNAVNYWNNWYNSFLYLDKKDMWPVAYYLRTIINGASTSADPGEVSAEKMQIAANIKSCSMVLMTLPIICIYPVIQKYYVQGMMLGGVKE